jgi:chemotaxis protein CheD
MAFLKRERLSEGSVKERMVGMGEVKLAKADDVLWAVLGSCIAVVLYDPQAEVGGIAHVMLPKKENKEDTYTGKYADTAIPQMLGLMVENGCVKKRIEARLIGGANMFRWKSKEPNMEIGVRNIEAVKVALKKERIPIIKSAIGGNVGYKVKFSALDGSIIIKFIDGRTIEL